MLQTDMIIDVALLALLLAMHISGTQSTQKENLQYIVMGILLLHLVLTTELSSIGSSSSRSSRSSRNSRNSRNSGNCVVTAPTGPAAPAGPVARTGPAAPAGPAAPVGGVLRTIRRDDPVVMANARGAFFDDLARGVGGS